MLDILTCEDETTVIFFFNFEVCHPRCVGSITKNFCVLHIQSNTNISLSSTVGIPLLWAGACECGEEPSGSIKRGEFLDQLQTS